MKSLKIEDAVDLKNAEKSNKLRNPKSLEEYSNENLEDIKLLGSELWFLLNPSYKKVLKEDLNVCKKHKSNFLKNISKNLALDKENKNKLLIKLLFEHFKSVKRMTGEGTFNNPYKISTEFGDGLFFDEIYLFKSNKIPKYIIDNYCYSNSYNLLCDYAKLKLNAVQLTGISWFGKPYLHSVLKLNVDGVDFIVDSNIHLVMTYDIYMKIFPMEVLSEITSEEAGKNAKYIQDTEKLFEDYQVKLDFSLVILSYHDFIERTKNSTSPVYDLHMII